MKLVFLRHGQSTWNMENKFTGWTDVDLSDHGVREAHDAGKVLKSEGYSFDVAHTSVLKRAIRTLWIVLEEMDLMWIPVHCSWKLNERHYGALQGLNKQATAEKYGDEQVHIWRRSYDIQPPPLTLTDRRHPQFDPRYANLNPDELPSTESLKDTLNRVLPFWRQTLQPALKQGRRMIISAHGNSIRALVKHLEHVSDEDIMGVNIPTGIPLVYEFDSEMRPVRHYFLGEEEAVTKAIASAAAKSKQQ
ncbi:MAG: 2,3-diphosphoglycerate-dependent phosphoglycerate mutase [Desulfobacterales bacterium]